MDTFEDRIKTYLDSEDFFALEVNGAWGIGKTFRIQSFIEKYKDDYRFIYVSMNGVKSFNELANLVDRNIMIKTMTKNEKLNNFLSNITSNADPITNYADVKVSNFTFNGNIFNAILSLFKRLIKHHSSRKIKRNPKEKFVFIIDEIERADKKVKFEEIASYISTNIQEKFRAKAILVGNMNQITDKEALVSYREKVTSKVIDVSVFSNVPISEIIMNELKDVQEKSITSDFIKVFEYEYPYTHFPNIRILISSIQTVKTIFDIVKLHVTNDNYFLVLTHLVKWVSLITLIQKDSSIFEKKDLDIANDYSEAHRISYLFKKLPPKYNSLFDLYNYESLDFSDAQSEIISYIANGKLDRNVFIQIYSNQHPSNINHLREALSRPFYFKNQKQLTEYEYELVERSMDSDRYTISERVAMLATMVSLEEKHVWLIKEYTWKKLFSNLIAIRPEHHIVNYIGFLSQLEEYFIAVHDSTSGLTVSNTTMYFNLDSKIYRQTIKYFNDRAEQVIGDSFKRKKYTDQQERYINYFFLNEKPTKEYRMEESTDNIAAKLSKTNIQVNWIEEMLVLRGILHQLLEYLSNSFDSSTEQLANFIQSFDSYYFYQRAFNFDYEDKNIAKQTQELWNRTLKIIADMINDTDDQLHSALLEQLRTKMAVQKQIEDVEY